jgi:hypothetical protein
MYNGGKGIYRLAIQIDDLIFELASDFTQLPELGRHHVSVFKLARI